MDKEKAQRLFVGPKFDKFVNKKFSVPALFFSFMYMAYRKMFLYALIAEAISILVTIIGTKINMSVYIFISLAFNIGLGFLVPVLYRKFYADQASKIISRNADKSEDVVVTELQKKGGTSILYLIAIIVINSMISGSIMANAVSNYTNDLLNDMNIEYLEDLDYTYDSTSFENLDSSYTSDFTYDLDKDSVNEDDIASVDKVTAISSGYYGDMYYIASMYIENTIFVCTEEEYNIVQDMWDYEELALNIKYVNKQIFDNDDGMNYYYLYSFDVVNLRNNEIIDYNADDFVSFEISIGYPGIGSSVNEVEIIDQTEGVYSNENEEGEYYSYTMKLENNIEIEARIYNNSKDASESPLETGKKYKVILIGKEGTFGTEYTIENYIEE